MIASLVASESASEHRLWTDITVHAEALGVIPLLLLHFEAVGVLVVGCLPTEQGRVVVFRVGDLTIESARIGTHRTNHHVHASLDAVKTAGPTACLVRLLLREKRVGEVYAADPGVVTIATSHCRRCIG